MNLFIVCSPFQVISLHESIKQLNLKRNILIIKYTTSEKNNEQLEKMIDKKLFSLIIRLDFINIGLGKKSKFLPSIYLLKKLMKRTFNRLVVGDLDSFQKLLLCNIKAKEYYLLDDGTSAMRFYNNLNKNINMYKTNLRQRRYILFGLKINTNVKLRMFTLFNLKTTEKVEVIENKFIYLKSKYSLNLKKTSDDVYIVGQNFILSKIMNESDYISYLKILVKDYQDKNIFYLMHRSENLETLKSYDFMKNVTFIESKMPGELFFVTIKNKPYAIIGCVSTMFFSLNKIFGKDNIMVYEFDIDYFLRKKDQYSLEYRNLRQNNINIKYIELT